MSKKPNQRKRASARGWDPVAAWYDGWVGKDGSRYHRRLALPAVLELCRPAPGQQVLDIGAGQGVLAPHIHAAGAIYTGVDISPQLIRRARRHHPGAGRFLVGDARRLPQHPQLQPASFTTAVFLLSIQDMDPLEDAVAGAAWALQPGGRLVILMTHPCFRIPRQSGWGFDPNRKLRYRRVDSYLSRLTIPMKGYVQQPRGKTISFHRPLGDYVNALGAHGLLIDRLQEITDFEDEGDRTARRANREFPIFLALRARRSAQ